MKTYKISEKCIILPFKKNYLFRAKIKLDEKTPIILTDLINEIYKEGYSLSKPYLTYKIFHETELSDFSLPEKIIGYDFYCFWAATIGDRIDYQINAYLTNYENLKAHLLDSWASEAIEALNDDFYEFLKNDVKRISFRFSPGYGNYSILKNNDILKKIEENVISVDNKTGILTPRKSTVCIVGYDK